MVRRKKYFFYAIGLPAGGIQGIRLIGCIGRLDEQDQKIETG